MIDNLHHVLFEDENRELINLKFSKGPKEVSKEEFRDAAAQIIFEINTGLTTSKDSFGDRGRKKVKVADVIKQL